MTKMSDFDDVATRWTPDDPDERPALHRLSLAGALAAGDDELHILSYVGEFGHRPSTLADLAWAIAALEDEEELSTEWSTDGLVVRHASDGWLALFTAD